MWCARGGAQVAVEGWLARFSTLGAPKRRYAALFVRGGGDGCLVFYEPVSECPHTYAPTDHVVINGDSEWRRCRARVLCFATACSSATPCNSLPDTLRHSMFCSCPCKRVHI